MSVLPTMFNFFDECEYLVVFIVLEDMCYCYGLCVFSVSCFSWWLSCFVIFRFYDFWVGCTPHRDPNHKLLERQTTADTQTWQELCILWSGVLQWWKQDIANPAPIRRPLDERTSLQTSWNTLRCSGTHSWFACYPSTSLHKFKMSENCENICNSRNLLKYYPNNVFIVGLLAGSLGGRWWVHRPCRGRRRS